MISLRKYIESAASSISPKEVPVQVSGTAVSQTERLPSRDISTTAPEFTGLLAAYRAALTAMGASGQKALPALGDMVLRALGRISDNLGHSASPESIGEARHKVEEQLELWVGQAQQLQKDGEQAVQELLLLVTQAAESTGIRDGKFGGKITVLSGRLREVAGMNSLPLIRTAIAENVSALNACIVKMADESRESVNKLKSEIEDYRTRLQVSERLAVIDPLTGLFNRGRFEEELELRIASRQQFSLLIADLNGFKAANDRYGHLVGDDILRQFATELTAQFFPEDTVARWGGDEFVAIIAGEPKPAATRADRIRHWVLGEYRIALDNQTVTVTVDAALGIVNWNGAESGLELFARADKEMYRSKDGAREPLRR